MRPRLAAFALVAVPFAFAAPAQAATIEFGGPHGLAYAPTRVRIHPSDAVTWVGDFGMHPLHSARASEPYGSGPGTGGSLDHAFPDAGVYRFYCGIHGATTGENQVSGMSGEVVVTNNTPPAAAFTQSATQVGSGTRVGFDGSASHDAEGPVSYAWDLDGDGAFDDSAGATADRVYTSPAGEATTVSVRLRVTDGNSDAVGPESSVARHEVTVVGPTGTTGSPPPGSGGGTGGGSGPTGAGGTGSPGADSLAPRARLLGRKLAVRSHRVTLRLASDEPGRTTIALRAKGVTMARGGGRLATTARTFRLRLTAAGRRRLRHGRGVVRATLIVVAGDAAGNTRTLRRPVTVRA